ncbi:PhzF family phenazine biosynthesis protein [Salinibacter ruber]|nr:PhzF family phenazine biosynthesis protein [Salinibacter ruber]
MIATAPAEADDVDFVSRFFAPRVGVPEDPVTGSAHCALGPYWAARMGRTELTGRQVSARGGTVRVHLDTPDAERVALGGRAVTVVDGRLDA